MVCPSEQVGLYGTCSFDVRLVQIMSVLESIIGGGGACWSAVIAFADTPRF
jgi:hypothetical protein